MSASRKDKLIHLEVRTPDIANEIFVINWQFRIVADGVGSLKVALNPGIYKVKLRAGFVSHEEYVILHTNDKRVIREFPAIEFLSSVPLQNTVGFRKSHSTVAEEESLKNHVQAGLGSWIFIFIRTWIASPPFTISNHQNQSHPAKGLTLRDAQNNVIADLVTQSKSELVGGTWAACNVQVDPGFYRLSLDNFQGERLERTIIATRGWQTQVFLLQVHNEEETENSQVDLSSASILLSKGCGFSASDPDMRLTELVRLGMLNKRQTLSQEIRKILRGKFESPMLGIYSAHLLLFDKAPDFNLFRTIVRTLRNLLGTHPDVEALELQLRITRDSYIFTVPPMLRRSWSLITNITVARPDLILPNSLAANIANYLYEDEFWLTWINHPFLAEGISTEFLQNVDTALRRPEIATASSKPPTEQSLAFAAENKIFQAAKTKWAYPMIEILLANNEKPEQDGIQEQQWLKDIEKRTKAALQQFQMHAKLISSILTPNAATLSFAGNDGITVELVNKHRTEFLTTYSLNLVSVQPELGAVALSIERPKRQIVWIQDLWKQWAPDSTNGNQDLLIGVREADGELLLLSPDSQHAPHTLVGGSTGSGKSVLLRNIILAIAATNTPQQARIILIDPKQGIDYFNFLSLPHLEGGEIIDQRDSAMQQFKILVEEMEARYAKFKITRSPNLRSYNQKVQAHERLPVLWLIHDEFAEWMLFPEYKQKVSNIVSRLGVKARAAGIYLIFAAQRPDADVMPMQLRANLGNRLVLRVDSERTSKVALGEKGAERLLGRGHLLAKFEGSPLYFAQVPLVEEQFLEKLISAFV